MKCKVLALLFTPLFAWGAYQIPNQAVTQAKLAHRATGSTVAAGGIATSISSGSFSTNSGSYVNVTGAASANLTVTITTTGRPIFVGLISDGGNAFNTCLLSTTVSGGTSAQADYQIVRGGSAVVTKTSVFSEGASAATFGAGVPCTSLYMIDFESAGTYTYTLLARGLNGTSNAFATGLELVAYEL